MVTSLPTEFPLELLHSPSIEEEQNFFVANEPSKEEDTGWTDFSSSNPPGFNKDWNSTTASDNSDADAWVDRLLTPTTTSASPSSIAASPRDRASAGNGTYNYFYAAMAAADGEHLSNEEWIAQRQRRQERLLRQRRWQYEPQIFRSPEEQALSSHLQNATIDRNILLRNAATADPFGESIRPQGRRLRRWRARQIPITPHAQRERLDHWYTSLILASWRAIKYPFRFIVRAGNNNIDHEQSTIHGQPPSTTSNGERGHEETIPGGLIVEYPPDDVDQDQIYSGEGWWRDQPEDDDDDATARWSTGTAMETDSDSSYSSNDNAREEHGFLDNVDHFPPAGLQNPEFEMFPVDPFGD